MTSRSAGSQDDLAMPEPSTPSVSGPMRAPESQSAEPQAPGPDAAREGHSVVPRSRYPYSAASTLPSVLYPLLLLVAPFVISPGDDYLLNILTGAVLTAASCVGLAIITGWAKLLSFTQGAIYGIGAYLSAILVIRYDVPFLLLLVASVLAGAVAGVLLTLPTLRLKGAYFGIATIGIQMLIISAFLKGGTLTGGPVGIAGVPAPVIFGFEFLSPASLYVLCCIWLALVTVFAALLWRSRLGRQIRLTGHSPELAEALGVPVVHRKVFAFMSASGIGAGTGCLHAHVYGVIDPFSFSIQFSAVMLIIVLIGGRHGRINAVITAALIITLLPEYLRGLADIRLLIYGVAVIVLVLFAPEGLTGVWLRVESLIRRSRSSRPLPAARDEGTSGGASTASAGQKPETIGRGPVD